MRVDPARRTVTAQPGLRLGELDTATQVFGLATPLGIVSDTGIAGLTLGGGLGWLNGKHGLACAHGRVRPDGYGLLRLGRRDYGLFVEFDRGTVRPSALHAKFAAYQRYGRSPRVVRDYDGFPTILVVTAGPGPERRIVDAIRATAAGLGQQPPILLTTLGWIENEAAGPFGRIWLEPEQGFRRSWPGDGRG